MKQERTIKPLKYTSLEGISEKQLKEHHDVLYAGYVKKYNEIQAKLKEADKSEANATFSLIRELKLEETFALNAIKLHEAYFDNLGGNGELSGAIADMIIRDFGSIEAWMADFKAAGLASRGWVVLAYDWDDRALRNISLDIHNLGPVFNCTLVMVLDVYEHAYFVDYATGRKTYIEAFFKNLDWQYVNGLVQKYQLP